MFPFPAESRIQSGLSWLSSPPLPWPELSGTWRRSWTSHLWTVCVLLPGVELFQIQVFKSNFPQRDEILQAQLQGGSDVRLTDCLGEVQGIDLLQSDQVVGNLFEVLFTGQQLWRGFELMRRTKLQTNTLNLLPGGVETRPVFEQHVEIHRMVGGEEGNIQSAVNIKISHWFGLISDPYFISVEILCSVCMFSMFLMSLWRAWKSSLSWEKICVNIRMTRQELRPTPTITTILYQLNWVDWL